MSSRVPFEYRYALDAVMPACASAGVRTLICNIPDFSHELEHRGLDQLESALSTTALWIEPCVDTWRADLSHLSSRSRAGGTLFIIASRPLASLLPDRARSNWRPLGTRLFGLRALRAALIGDGFHVTASYGIHSLMAVGLNSAGRVAETLGRSDLGDQLHFSARLRYCSGGALEHLSTVSLIEAKMEHV